MTTLFTLTALYVEGIRRFSWLANRNIPNNLLLNTLTLNHLSTE